MPDEGVYPPNITAWFSSVIVREKPVQGGGLEPLLDGEDHNPGTQSDMDIKTLFLVTNELLSRNSNTSK